MKTCQSCKHTDVPDFSLYCGKCGQPDTFAITDINTCPCCDNPISIEHSACQSCGATRRKISPVYPKNTKLRKCERCGMLIPRKDRYCLNCGSTVPENEPSSQKIRAANTTVIALIILVFIIFGVVMPIISIIQDKRERDDEQQNWRLAETSAYEQKLTKQEKSG